MSRQLPLYMILMLLACVMHAAAHPLGNFSINQYSRLEMGTRQIKLRQVLDMAEIPTFQESAAIDADKDRAFSPGELESYAARLTAAYVANLRLTVNDEAIALRPVSTEVALEPGEGGLPTLKIIWDMAGDLPSAIGEGRVSLQNDNYAGRAGWNEMVVNATSRVSVFNSNSYATGITDELKVYANEATMAPLNERSAQFSFSTGTPPADAKPLLDRQGQAFVPAARDTFAELISVREITPMVALFGLLAAFGLGTVHAMSPGHGKAIVGAYLVGSKGTPKHAVFLGLTVTVTHTIGVFALGLITLFASSYILPERLMPFLGFVSGLLVFAIGIFLFKDRVAALYRGEHSHDGGEMAHSHDGVTHSHGGITHSHGGVEHSHTVPSDLRWNSLLALGISGGLVPCPSALVLMLSAISLGRTGYGMVLTLVFSLGLAMTLIVIGIIFLYMGKALGRTSLAENRIVRGLPVFSSLVVAFLGAAICYSSLS